MFLSELYCYNRRIVLTFLVNIQKTRSGSSYLKNLEIVRLEVNRRDSLKSMWISSTLRLFYITSNFTLLQPCSAELARNSTMNLSLRKTQQHIPVVTKTDIRGILRYIMFILWKILDLCQVLLRVVQLTCVFLPLVILYPLTLISVRLKNLWHKLLRFGKHWLYLSEL